MREFIRYFAQQINNNENIIIYDMKLFEAKVFCIRYYQFIYIYIYDRIAKRRNNHMIDEKYSHIYYSYYFDYIHNT